MSNFRQFDKAAYAFNYFKFSALQTSQIPFGIPIYFEIVKALAVIKQLNQVSSLSQLSFEDCNAFNIKAYEDFKNFHRMKTLGTNS